MGQISRDEFLQMQAQREQTRAQAATTGPRVGFFSLKDDGDEAIVRFAYNDPSEFDVFTVHPVTIDGKFRKVNCINDLKAGVHSCPLCAAGIQLQQRFYIKLIEYTRDEQGNIVPQPRVWERPASYMQILNNLFTEYGSLCNSVFKIKRSGERGSMQTTYSIMYSNPSIYNEELYKKDFSAFENYSPLGTAILDRNESELRELVNEAGETSTVGTTTNETFTPSVAQATYTPPKMGVDSQPAWSGADSGQEGVRRVNVQY